MNHPKTNTPSPLRLLEIISREGGLEALSVLSAARKAALFRRLEIVMAVSAAEHGKRTHVVAALASVERLSISTINRWLSQYNLMGWRGLVDNRTR